MALKQKEKNVIWLAYFVRYGYFALLALLLWGMRKIHVTQNLLDYVSFGAMVIYGFYYLVGLLFNFNHLYCAMQNADHQKMTPFKVRFTRKMERDILLIGFIFIIIGIFGIVAVYYDV